MELGKPSQYFNAYYHDNRLLIQFVISEFLMTYTCSSHLKHLSTQLSASPALFDEILPQITQDILILLGTPHDNSRPWSSHWRACSLGKLKKYCEQLSSNAFHHNKTFLQMHKNVYRAWICCLHCFEMIKASQPPPSPFTSTFKPILPASLNRALLSLNVSLNTMAKLLLKAISLFAGNENVLLFLSRRQEQLTSIYGAEVISQIFVQNPDIIKTNYVNRGFESLVHIL